MELLVPLRPVGVLTPWLNSGQKMYHLAYEVLDIFSTQANLEAVGAKTTVAPVAAIAFEGRKICFMMLPNLLLIEIIESGQTQVMP